MLNKQTNNILCVCVGMYLSVCLPVHQHVHVHTQVFIEANINLGCSFSDVVTVTVGFFRQGLSLGSDVHLLVNLGFAGY